MLRFFKEKITPSFSSSKLRESKELCSQYVPKFIGGALDVLRLLLILLGFENRDWTNNGFISFWLFLLDNVMCRLSLKLVIWFKDDIILDANATWINSIMASLINCWNGTLLQLLASKKTCSRLCVLSSFKNLSQKSKNITYAIFGILLTSASFIGWLLAIWVTETMASSLPLSSRPYDWIFIILFSYFIFSCIFIESKYCFGDGPMDPTGKYIYCVLWCHIFFYWILGIWSSCIWSATNVAIKFIWRITV